MENEFKNKNVVIANAELRALYNEHEMLLRKAAKVRRKLHAFMYKEDLKTLEQKPQHPT